jgi:hypothetical protein
MPVECPVSLSISNHFQLGCNFDQQVPTGNTQFRFKAGGFNFHSTSYDWLVVTGSDYAMFKGKGRINGDPDSNGNDYMFQIWAGDESDAGSGEDTFRLMITGSSGIVYDNGSDQILGGGNIQIHQ